MSITSRDGTSIGYDRTGTGPAVILVDGAMCYRGSSPLDPLVPLLAPHFTVYTYDRRGRGDSGDTAPYAVDREVEDLAALISAAGGTACLYGVSSGAILCLLAAARGAGVARLGLFEPPLAIDGAVDAQRNLSSELARLVAAGQRGEAVEHFQLTIGIPGEVVAGMRHTPARPKLEAIAHTLVYDTTISVSLPLARLTDIATPALVIDSQDSPDGLRSAAKAIGDTLPAAQRVSLRGKFHSVAAEDLAPVLTGFFTT